MLSVVPPPSPDPETGPRREVTRRAFLLGAGAIVVGGAAAIGAASLMRNPSGKNANVVKVGNDRIRAIVAEVSSGMRQGHLVVLGDSIAFGAAGAGATVPKNLNSWPGVLRASLDERFGAAGTGITIAQHALIDNPSWDNHIDPSGAQRVGMGLHRTGVWKVPAGEETSFVADASEFWVWNLSASGPLARVRVNGADVGRMRNVKSDRSNAAELISEDGYGGTQMMTCIAAADGGRNELTLEAEDGHLALLGIEGRVPTKGTWRVTNASINGKALSTLFAGDGNDDPESELFGLGMVDSLRADILVIALGTNDWHGGATKETVKENLTTLIQRQRATGTSVAGGTLAGGDAVLLFNPQPSIDDSGYPTYIATAKTPWDQIRAAFHEVSAEQHCELIDLGDLWGGFGKSAELGYMADDLHVSDAGAKQIARAVEDHLFS